MAWGGSIGQVAQNEITMSAQQRAAAERQLEMLVRQHEADRNNAQQDRALNQRDTSLAEQRRQFDIGTGAQSAQETRIGKHQDADLALRREEFRQRERDRKLGLLQQRRKFTMDEQDKQLRLLLPSAQRMADEGAFDSTEDAMRHFPTLAQQAPMLAARSKAVRKSMEDELAADQADAALLNEGPAKIARNHNMIAAERENSWNPDMNHWWRSDEADTGAIGEWQADATAVGSAMNSVRGDRNRMGRLQPDVNGRFAPVTTLPWRPSGTTTTTQPAPVEGPTATNPQTGQKIIFKDGKWQPYQ